MARPLSDREKLVLYGLVRAPLCTDGELAASAGLKATTAAAIRRRLRERGYYARVRLPCLQSLGGELLGVTYFHYKATIPLNIRLITGTKLVREHREVFWAASEYTQAISLQLARSFTDAKANVADIESLYTAQGFLDEGGITFLPFPFAISRIPLLFDFEPLLRQSFGLHGKDVVVGCAPRAQQGARLTAVGRRVYLGLVAMPELSDTELASAISVSQRTVSKLRAAFEGGGALKTVTVPNLRLLGFKMLVFDHAKLNLRLPEKQRMEILGELVKIKPPIFLAISGDDVAALTAYEDFETYRRCINGFSQIYKQDDIYAREPKRLQFSLTEMRMLKEHVYGPIVEKVLGI
jgi:hypothetical protein